MSSFAIEKSLERARRRLGDGRSHRSDRGARRLPPELQTHLQDLLSGHDRPPVRQLRATLGRFCERRGLPVPARATLYSFMQTAPTPLYRIEELPDAVRRTLHNVAQDADVPGPILVRRAFEAGSLAAVSYASSLPWLCLYQADRLRGWRPKSHAMLRAVMRFRRI